MMCNQSSDQDSSLEDESSSSHLSTHSDTIQTEKNQAMTSRSRDKYTIKASGKYSGRRLRGQFSASTRQRITVVANQIPCHNRKQLCAGRQSEFLKGKELYLKEARPAPKMVLKSAWQSKQQQQQPQQDTSESSVFSGSPRNWCEKRNKVPQQTTQTYLASGKLMRINESTC